MCFEWTYTSNVDDNVRVGELGDGLRNDSLAATESTRDTDGTTLDTGEEGVEDTLTDNEGRVGAELVVYGTRDTDGPLLHHAVLGLLALEFNLENLLVDGVLSSLCDTGDGTASSGRKKDLVVVEQRVFPDGTENVTTSDVVADLVLGGLELPLSLAVQGRHVDTTGNVNAVGDVRDGLERALNTVVNGLHQTRAELDGQRLAGSVDGVTNGDTSCVGSANQFCLVWICKRTSLFVDLNGGLVVVDSDNLTDETVLADFDLHFLVWRIVCWRRIGTYEFVHGDTDHVLGDNDGTGRALVAGRRSWTGSATYPDTEKMEPSHGQLDASLVESDKVDSPCWDSTSLEGAMAVVVVVLVELAAMGLWGRSMDSESCSTGDKTAARSESFLVTRSTSDGRVTSLGRNPSMQLSRLQSWNCSCRPPPVETDVECCAQTTQPVLVSPDLKQLKPDYFYHNLLFATVYTTSISVVSP